MTIIRLHHPVCFRLCEPVHVWSRQEGVSPWQPDSRACVTVEIKGAQRVGSHYSDWGQQFVLSGQRETRRRFSLGDPLRSVQVGLWALYEDRTGLYSQYVKHCKAKRQGPWDIHLLTSSSSFLSVLSQRAITHSPVSAPITNQCFHPLQFIFYPLIWLLSSSIVIQGELVSVCFPACVCMLFNVWLAESQLCSILPDRKEAASGSLVYLKEK